MEVFDTSPPGAFCEAPAANEAAAFPAAGMKFLPPAPGMAFSEGVAVASAPVSAAASAGPQRAGVLSATLSAAESTVPQQAAASSATQRAVAAAVSVSVDAQGQHHLLQTAVRLTDQQTAGGLGPTPAV